MVNYDYSKNFRFDPRFCLVCNNKYLPTSGTQKLCSVNDLKHTIFKTNRKKKNRISSYNAKGFLTSRKRRARRKYWLDKYKTAKGCTLCGWNKHSSALDWDHLNSEEKQINVSRSLEAKLTRLFFEIRKCRILCANCHRIHSAEENVYYNKTLRNREFKNK